jgi:ABC-2 type transport system ATP-binding protein
VTLTFADDADAVRAADRTRAATGREVRREADAVSARVADGPRLLPGLLHDLAGAGIRVATAEVTRPTLDDVFLALTGRSLREGGAAAETPESTVRELEAVA